jgi:hypothetical protein
MSGFADFAAVKDRAPIEQVVAMLGLHLKPHGDQLRGACPRCGSQRQLPLLRSGVAYRYTEPSPNCCSMI